jgi:hypothetical protein
MPKKIENNLSESEIHYQNLISYFKYIVTITLIGLGILTTYFFFVFGKDRKDMREDLNNFKETAKNSIENIRNEAANIAISEAKRKIDEAFRDNNIEKFIEDYAKNEYKNEFSKMLELKTKDINANFENELNEIVLLNNASLRMRLGFKDGLVDLINLKNNAKNNLTKNKAQEYISGIGKDFDTKHSKIINELNRASKDWDIKKHLLSSGIVTDTNEPEIYDQMINNINSTDNLDYIAIDIIFFRELSKEDFKMFDLEAIKEWYINYKKIHK